MTKKANEKFPKQTLITKLKTKNKKQKQKTNTQKKNNQQKKKQKKKKKPTKNKKKPKPHDFVFNYLGVTYYIKDSKSLIHFSKLSRKKLIFGV